ncbi:xanthine phosphoribosyltransferase [Bacillus cereus]|uniref:xanthine phosphoribosyltransferase n=1 Tax=Bacillus cereus TaxID=1396 RepID=UPI0024BE14CA|nr:xanthine phosphoribosyltransferase [Bacillus cereus]
MNENITNQEEVDGAVDTDTLIENKDEMQIESQDRVYTQADIDNLQSQIDELSKYKPQELNEVEIKLQEKVDTLWHKQVDLELKEQGLEVFKDFIRADVDDTEALNNQITKLKEIVGTLELSNSYQPTNHKQVDGYSIAKKNKDTKSMISQKLNF